MKKSITSFVLLVLVSILWICFATFVPVLVGNDFNAAFASKNKYGDKKGKHRNHKIILNDVSDSPDPFSVHVHRTTSQFKAQFHVRKTDGLGHKSDKREKQFLIRHKIRIIDASSGSQLITLTGETEIHPPPRHRGRGHDGKYEMESILDSCLIFPSGF